jgi:A/G-specific adenine glycosylase
MKTIERNRVVAIRRKIWRFYSKHRRSFPFRETTDPYRIAVSEIMLQQTQAERVVSYYDAWTERWPDWQSLAQATNRQLLSMWSGLGYNRRALFLGQLAQAVVSEHGGILPDDPKKLVELPGIGPYTARAILIFAFNRPLVTIDTNIRRVVLHEFRLPATTSRKRIEEIAEQLLPPERARDWHYALMDYSRVALSGKLESVPPAGRQSRFEGSQRQIRGEIVRQLIRKKFVRINTIAKVLDRSESDVSRAAAALEREGVIRRRNSTLRLA